MHRDFFVYIMSNVSKTLYIGMTNDLERRVWEHKSKTIAGFTTRYNITNLVYFESHSSPSDAIAREKQLKHWNRSKKLDLIESMNPEWCDLGSDWRDGRATPSAVIRSA
jgi:putative endonuclease